MLQVQYRNTRIFGKIHTYADTHPNTKYICKHIRKHTEQPYTHKQTQNTDTDTPTSANTSIRTHTVRATNTQKQEQTRAQQEPYVRERRECKCAHMGWKGAYGCCETEGNAKWVRQDT